VGEVSQAEKVAVNRNWPLEREREREKKDEKEPEP
jgi:hypothetical protein